MGRETLFLCSVGGVKGLESNDVLLKKGYCTELLYRLFVSLLLGVERQGLRGVERGFYIQRHEVLEDSKGE